MVVSADAAPATAEELLALGAAAFVTKPIAVGDLLDALAAVLERVAPR